MFGSMHSWTYAGRYSAVPEVNLPAGDDVAMHESTTESTELNDGPVTLAAKNALFISALPPTLLRKDLEDVSLPTSDFLRPSLT